MRRMKWAGLVVAILLISSCLMTWVTIPSKHIVVSGIDAAETNFGKPGYLHLVLAAIFILLNFLPRIWAKRTNLAVTALNVAWAIRNYFLITACRGGDCPEKHFGIYLVLVASVFMLVAALFPDIEIPAEKTEA